jgi:glycosyltransferase involved in cell wall biosynthesis
VRSFDRAPARVRFDRRLWRRLPDDHRLPYDHKVRIAILGTRGVPAAYGGFETFAEELGARLVERGHEVTVYGRSHVIPAGLKLHRGMRIRRLPTIQHKYLGTVAHTALSVLDALFRRFDIALICNNANAPFALIPRLGGAKVVLNVDGLEWKRAKWGRARRWYYRACASLAPRLPIVLVSDARVIADWYRQHRGSRTVYIPYGSDARLLPPGETLARMDLRPGGYLLYVTSLEPENNAHVVLEAYRQAGGLAMLGVPMVLVGDAPHASSYKARLAALAAETPGVSMPGSVFGEGYIELQSNALAYIQAAEVAGTYHPALVQAMSRGACIIANDVPEHREVLGDAGLYYDRNDAGSLAAAMLGIVGDPDSRVKLGAAAAARAEARFSWQRVTDQYEALFQRLLGGSRT